ncbi:MAG: AsmA family protein, partial [Luteitalea sp.]|nr:AsmA family protein [Luteitalea sp.]
MLLRRPVRLAAVLLRGALYVLAGVLVLIAIAMAAVETGWAKNQLRGLIVRQANQYLTASLEIGRLEGSIFRGIQLGDVRLSREGTTLVSIDDVSLSYSIRELLQGGVVIRRISLARPQIVAARQPDGRWNLGALVKREARQNGSSGPGRPIHILSIEISDATITLADPLAFGAARVPSRFDDLDARFAFEYVPVTWSLDFTSASW